MMFNLHNLHKNNITSVCLHFKHFNVVAAADGFCYVTFQKRFDLKQTCLHCRTVLREYWHEMS